MQLATTSLLRQDSIASCAAASSIPSTRDNTSNTYSILAHIHHHLLFFLIFVESFKLLLAGLNAILNQFLSTVLVRDRATPLTLLFAPRRCLLESPFHPRPNTPPSTWNCSPPSAHPLPCLADLEKRKQCATPSISLHSQLRFETVGYSHYECTTLCSISVDGLCLPSIHRWP